MSKTNEKNSGLVYEEPNIKDHKADGITVGGISIQKSYPISLSKNLHQFGDIVSKEHGEVQSNDFFDTFSCVLFTILKAVSTYLKKVYNQDWDFSESYQAILAGVKPGVGTSVRAGMESVRVYKSLEEKYRPFTKWTTKDVFFAAVTAVQLELAKNGPLKDFDFHWDLIDDSSNVPHQKIINNYEFTVAVLTGRAWIFNNEKGVYVDEGQNANHCFLGVDYDENHKYGNIIVDDSYRYDWNDDKEDHTDLNEFKKLLSKDFRIWSAHRCWLTPKANNHYSLLDKIKNMIKNIWMWFETVGSPKGMRGYYVPTDENNIPKGKQAVNFEDPEQAIKILYKAIYDAGLFKKTDWPGVKDLEDKKFI